MAKTCPNGHVNDDVNRFCDQCGLPLAESPEAPQQAAAPDVSASGTGAASVACPVCGQENVPGTAFCDNCGAALPPPQPAADAAAQPEATPVPIAADGGDSGAGTTTVCSQCGTVNDAANQFCENCGARLDQQAATSSADSAAVGTTAGAGVYDATASDASAPAAADESAPAVEPFDASTGLPAGEQAAAPVAADEQTPIAPTAEDSQPPTLPSDSAIAAPEAAPVADTAAPVAASADSGAERQRLQTEIDTQRQLVSQLEDMSSRFGASTPASIRMGLDEARAALARAEADLAALPPEKPPVDPAEVKRLEDQVETQRDLVEQLEAMASKFGAATPAVIRQGLDEARAALEQAKQELVDYTGGVSSASSAAPAAPSAPAAEEIAATPAESAAATPAPQVSMTTPEAPPVPMPSVPEIVPSMPATVPPAPTIEPAAAASAPPATNATIPASRGTDALPEPAAPQGSGPRLVGRDGKSITLPRSGGDLVIGRDDPISGIHPQIDLTPYGGEAGGVSRRHASISEQSGQWMLTDLDSTNYTRINGNRIAPHTPTPLPDGARVQFGRLEFEFHAM